VTGLPTLIVVSGPPGAGKTTLAHALARAVGCPAICRDEITLRTLPTFFGVLELLLRAGVTTVAEAAFQDRLWRPRLAPLRGLAQVRIVHCRVDADVAWARIRRRQREDPLRRAHADAHLAAASTHVVNHNGFQRLESDDPWIEVDTTDGYDPGIDQLAAFVNG
jgi:predicted kinase